MLSSTARFEILGKKVFTVQKNTYPIFEIPEKVLFFFFKIEIYFEHVLTIVHTSKLVLRINEVFFK